VNAKEKSPSNLSASEYERMKASLVSLISHELRTPLTYVSASLEMIEIALETPEMQGDIHRFLTIIDQGVKQLHSTIDELLLFSNLEANPPEKVPAAIHEAVDPQELICEIVNILKPTFQGKKQVVEVSIQENLPLLTTDLGKLSEVLLQLLSNAIKFTPQEGHIRVMVIGSEKLLTVMISDNGPGIPEKIREAIFNPFYQQEDHLTREHGGLGLGLTLVQRLSNLLGGRLSLEVEEGKQTGSTFILELPRVNPIYVKHQQMTQMLADVKALSHSNAEKEAQLQGLKAQLLEYTEALDQASQSNRAQQNEIEKMNVDMINGLASALEARDPFIRGRSQRIGAYAHLLAEALQLDGNQCDTLAKGCLLSDIGYIGIADAVLKKDHLQSLSEEEVRMIQSHPRIGVQMLKHIKAFEPIVPLVMYHHENWDGSGYPEGLKGQEIPLLARIIRVADAFDAMLSDRAYRQRFAPDYAVAEIDKCSGTQFDPELAKLFTRLWHTGVLEPVVSSFASNLLEKGTAL
jgi:HD-GYP domain-containing protein (c-di-GMP phosphodiesterase class II)/nitrogen-specific signal transduction histidine kinase